MRYTLGNHQPTDSLMSWSQRENRDGIVIPTLGGLREEEPAKEVSQDWPVSERERRRGWGWGWGALREDSMAKDAAMK